MIEDKFRSIIPQYRRDPITKEIISQPRSEQITVNPVNPVYVTAELIDEYFRVIIQDMSSQYLIEVFNFDDISEGHFYVNYTSRKIYFDNASIGVKYTIYYNGMGGEFVDASLISTQIDTAGDVVQTLQDILTGDSIGNLNESWGRATYIQPSNNVLQLTRNRRQYVTNGTLLTGTTIKLPTMELGDYLQLTLMFYADSDLVLVFDDNIKWSNQPIIQGGRTYKFSFWHVEGTWYCEWVKLERYLKDYIYKAGDTCNLLTGGYTYVGTVDNLDGKLELSGTSTSVATTINNINIDNYYTLYLEFEFQNYSFGNNMQIWCDGFLLYQQSNNDVRRILIKNLVGAPEDSKIIFRANNNSKLTIYNAWLEKNEFVDTSQEIFTTSEKTKLSSISANANKVIDSTINGNILIDGVETNVYTHPSGTNPHGTTKTDIELGNVDNTSDLNKPISTATQTALDGKVDDSQVLTNVPVGALFTDTTYDLFSSTADGLVPLSGGGITKYLRADGTWVVPSDTNTTYEVATTSANGLMSIVDKTKLDGVETGANNYVHPTNHTPSIIIQDSSNRFVTDTEKATWNGKATTSVATTSVNGLMSSDDKVKLDSISTVTSSEVTDWFNTL